MTFAEAAALPDPSGYAAVGWVLIVLVTLAGGALLVKKLFQRDPPLHQEFATKEAFARHLDVDHAEIRRELERQTASRKGIYERLDQLDRQIAEVRAESQQQSKTLTNLDSQVAAINTRIDAIPGRMITLLRETKGLI